MKNNISSNNNNGAKPSIFAFANKPSLDSRNYIGALPDGGAIKTVSQANIDNSVLDQTMSFFSTHNPRNSPSPKNRPKGNYPNIIT